MQRNEIGIKLIRECQSSSQSMNVKTMEKQEGGIELSGAKIWKIWTDRIVNAADGKIIKKRIDGGNIFRG